MGGMEVTFFQTNFVWASLPVYFGLYFCYWNCLPELYTSSRIMPSKESYEAQKEEKSLVQKAKREANQEDILAAALGMRMGPQKPPATFWQPLKLFAYSQLTSLVRRATLKDSELTPRPEKVHNFKVRLNPLWERLLCVWTLKGHFYFFTLCIDRGLFVTLWKEGSEGGSVPEWRRE